MEAVLRTLMRTWVAHPNFRTSGRCPTETKRTFAGGLVEPDAGGTGGEPGEEFAGCGDWMPDMNRCWFSQRVLDVKLKYGMTVDRDGASALELVLAGCESTELVKPARAE